MNLIIYLSMFRIQIKDYNSNGILKGMHISLYEECDVDVPYYHFKYRIVRIEKGGQHPPDIEWIISKEIK
ncbi:MAG: hypothetical protein K2P09_05150 [Erysipelotrichales bacterium]|nr:hypothetical protein [Erysipelotrichales bacterium]